MNTEDVKRLAAEHTPQIDIKIEKDFYRHNVINSLTGTDNIGIELGVAGGDFSKRMVDSGKFKTFYGVDLYGDHHDTLEYKNALKLVGLEKNYKLLRMSFDDALGLFDDHYFDFVYFDGYAHTGEEGGKSFVDWFNKVKVGGIVAGDDYHDDWPLVKWAVNTFAKTLGVELSITGLRETVNLSRYPSWFFTKNKDVEFSGPLDETLYAVGQASKAPPQSAAPSKNISLTPEQIFNLFDMFSKNFPDEIPKMAAILKQNLPPS